VCWSSIRVAGNKFDEAILSYIKKKYSVAGAASRALRR